MSTKKGKRKLTRESILFLYRNQKKMLRKKNSRMEKKAKPKRPLSCWLATYSWIDFSSLLPFNFVSIFESSRRRVIYSKKHSHKVISKADHKIAHHGKLLLWELFRSFEGFSESFSKAVRELQDLFYHGKWFFFEIFNLQSLKQFSNFESFFRSFFKASTKFQFLARFPPASRKHRAGLSAYFSNHYALAKKIFQLKNSPSKSFSHSCSADNFKSILHQIIHLNSKQPAIEIILKHINNFPSTHFPTSHVNPKQKRNQHRHEGNDCEL